MSETFNIKEVHEKLDALVALMSDKGCVLATADLSIESGEGIRVWLRSSFTGPQVGDNGYFCLTGDTVGEALAGAKAHIRAMPNPEDAALQRHVKRLSDVADKARADNIPDEYIAPIPKIIKAISDNLLEAPEAEK